MGPKNGHGDREADTGLTVRRRQAELWPHQTAEPVRCWATGLVAVALVLCALLPVSAQSPSRARYANGLLKVSGDQVSLPSLLAHATGQSRIEIICAPAVDEFCALEFVDMPVGEALRRLLATTNYIMTMHPGEAGLDPVLRVRIHSRHDTTDAVAGRAADNAAGGPEGGPVSLDDAEADELDSIEATGFFEGISIEALLDATRSPVGAVRVRALRLLAAREPTTAAEVVDLALGDTNPAVRAAVSELLAEQSSATEARQLVQLLHDADPAVRLSALESLSSGRIGANSVRFIVEALTEETHAVTPGAIAGRSADNRASGPENGQDSPGKLAEQTGADEPEQLVRRLRDADPDVRLRALELLSGRRVDANGVLVILQALTDN